MKQKNIEQMTREQVIKELAGVLHPATFHLVLWDSTAELKAYLMYARTPDKERRHSQKAGAKHVPVKCGCGAPWAHTGKHWPAGMRVERTVRTSAEALRAIAEGLKNIIPGDSVVVKDKDGDTLTFIAHLEQEEKADILRRIMHRLRGRQ